ncbi:hypothetical protein DL768_005080 [Monosporascus sp. mg162]|nr:hypothetical protein DL768_005080 [Monosporascus sp. mg162]
MDLITPPSPVFLFYLDYDDADRSAAAAISGCCLEPDEVIGPGHHHPTAAGCVSATSGGQWTANISINQPTDSYVIPGNIIYKQRGTKWFPGENCGMGRDHTIFALASGYVKYYRDPARHPKRQYIGVVFNKEDKLPYPPHAARKRKLNMVASPIPPPRQEPALSPSGIPTAVVRQGTGRRPHPREERVIKLRQDSSYAYQEENWRLGTLVRTEKRKMGSRRVAMRHRRRRKIAIAREMRAEREDKIARRKEALDAQRAARIRKMREYRQRRKAEAAAAAAAANPKGAQGPPSPPPAPRAEA